MNRKEQIIAFVILSQLGTLILGFLLGLGDEHYFNTQLSDITKRISLFLKRLDDLSV